MNRMNIKNLLLTYKKTSISAVLTLLLGSGCAMLEDGVDVDVLANGYGLHLEARFSKPLVVPPSFKDEQGSELGVLIDIIRSE